MPGGTKESHKTPQSGCLVSKQRFELRISKMWNRMLRTWQQYLVNALYHYRWTSVRCVPKYHVILLQQHVSASEVLVPGAMMLVLSMIHSQIVSTHTGPARDPTGGKSRRVKRTKRRLLFSSRSRTVCKWLCFQLLFKNYLQKVQAPHFRIRMILLFCCPLDKNCGIQIKSSWRRHEVVMSLEALLHLQVALSMNQCWAFLIAWGPI